MSRPFHTLATSSNAVARHWQLILLGFTSIALSIASGWTTWDGMRYFTDNGVLSFLITFGIQGVMLITAWMIGETFANKEAELSTVAASRRRVGLGLTTALIFCSIVVGAVIAWFSSPYPNQTSDWHVNYPIAVAGFFAGLLLLRNILYVSGNGEIAQPYDHSVKTILRNIPLWLMFLVCMGASVFFSFDSLFDKIFSSEARARAGQSRVQMEVAGLLSDLSDKLEEDRRDAAISLFSSPQWRRYEGQIPGLEVEASKVPKTLQAIRKSQTDLRDQEISRALEAISADQAKLEALNQRIRFAAQELRESDNVLQPSKSLARSLEEKLSHQRNLMRHKRAEAEGEAIGIGVTQKTGKGPQYRQIKKEQEELRISVELLVERLDDAQARVAALVEERLSKATHAAKLKSEAAKFNSRLELAKARLTSFRDQGNETVDQSQNIAGHLNSLREAERNFINAPDKETFAKLQHQCTITLASLKSVENEASSLKHIDCAAGFASEITAKVFAANAVLVRFREACGRETQVDGRSTDDLLQLGQRCLQTSGLQSEDILPLRTRLRKSSLRRDDRAHRFIVTWNAFFDKNRLAFVALFIAVAIDGLVFMSGLFGASARARLSSKGAAITSTTPENKEAILDVALLPHAQDRARAVLEAVTYTNPSEPGILGHVDVSKADGEGAKALRTVLNAASAIDLAIKTGPGQKYAIKPELIDFLSRRMELQRGANSNALAESKPEELLRVALGSQKRRVAQVLLQVSRPIEAQSNFTHEIDIRRCPPDIRSLIAGVLNAGVTSGFVLGATDDSRFYLISAAFFSLIARIAENNHRVARQTDAHVPRFTRIRKRLTFDQGASTSSSPSDQVSKERDTPQPLHDNKAKDDSEQKGKQPSGVPPCTLAKQNSSEEQTHNIQASGNHTFEESSAFLSFTDRTQTSTSDHIASTAQSQDDLDTNLRPSTEAKTNNFDVFIAQKTEEPAQPPSKLIVFSNEAKLRKAERAAVEIEAREQEAGRSTTKFSPLAFDELHRVTGLTKNQLAGLSDPQTVTAHKAAYATLRSLRTQDEDLDKQISNLEKNFRQELDEALTAHPTSCPDQSQRSAPDRLSPVAQFIEENFGLIFLHSRGLDLIRAWCMASVSQLESAADAYVISGSDTDALTNMIGNMERVAHSFLAIDQEHAAAWEHLIYRFEELREAQERSVAFGDIMP